jgi:hypothetical protein
MAENCSNRNILVPKRTSFRRADVLLLILPPLIVGDISNHFLNFLNGILLSDLFHVNVLLSTAVSSLIYGELHVGISDYSPLPGTCPQFQERGIYTRL